MFHLLMSLKIASPQIVLRLEELFYLPKNQEGEVMCLITSKEQNANVLLCYCIALMWLKCNPCCFSVLLDKSPLLQTARDYARPVRRKKQGLYYILIVVSSWSAKAVT